MPRSKDRVGRSDRNDAETRPERRAVVYQPARSGVRVEDKIDWNRIEKFIGYGRADAPIVFVGMEEGLASEDGLRDDLLLRSRFSPIMDLEEAHRGIDGDRLFSDTPRRQPTWRVMADVMLRYEGASFESPSQRAGARTLYRAKKLGRSDGNSLLTEILPYPHRNNSTWLYATLSAYATRTEYERVVLAERLQLLRSALREYPRAAIICYGRGAWPRFRQLFENARWQNAGRFEVSEWNGTRVTLCDHFATKYFNTDAQLDGLERVALQK